MAFHSTLSHILRTINTKISTNPFIYFTIKPFVHIARALQKRNSGKFAQHSFEKIDNFMGNIQMEVDKGTYMGGSIYWCGFHHLSEMIFMKHFLKPEMTFVDIGGNQGEFSLIAAKKLTKGKVITFEPVSAYFQLLKQNMELNGFSNVELFQLGLSNQKGELPIYTSLATEIHRGSVHDGLSSLYKTEERGVLQEVIKLDVFDNLLNLNRLDFIKIDVEGAELFALKGAEKHLRKFLPDILIEISENTYNAAGYSTKEMFEYLQSFGYEPYKIKRGIPQPLTYAQVAAEGDYLFRAKK